jgi:hypothetical protein
MGLIKKTVTVLFSDMYFNKPYLKIVHISLLLLLSSYTDIFGYPIEYENTENKIIKKFKIVSINESEIITITPDFIENLTSTDDLFYNKYYLFVNLNGVIELIPPFPPLIIVNFNKYRYILRRESAKSTYLIS